MYAGVEFSNLFSRVILIYAVYAVVEYSLNSDITQTSGSFANQYRSLSTRTGKGNQASSAVCQERIFKYQICMIYLSMNMMRKACNNNRTISLKPSHLSRVICCVFISTTFSHDIPLLSFVSSISLTIDKN